MALTDRDKRTLKIGGIVVGVLAAAYLLMTLLGSGGGEVVVSPPTFQTTPPSGGGTTSETPSLQPSPALLLPVRDPFSIPPGFEVSPVGSSSPVATSPGATTPGTTRTPTADTAHTTIGGHTITLLDTSSTGVEQASVEVDATVYHPSAGQSFGPNRQYMLQSVSGFCATFLFGDEAFTLCVPQNK